MLEFIILCLFAFAAAAPQGYNYPIQPVNQYLAASAGAGSATHDQGRYNYQQQPLISKRFFLHSAPEEEEEGSQVQHRDIVIGQPRKTLNVVFIKSPNTAVQRTKVRITPAANEEKTVIYVLAKKASEDEVITHVEEPHTATAKPEVFFIKYKTNEEAEHAQRSIQAEYDSLGGSSITSNEGIASVTSVIGSLDGHGAAVNEIGGDAVTSNAADSSAYLPAQRYTKT